MYADLASGVEAVGRYFVLVICCGLLKGGDVFLRKAVGCCGGV